MNNLEEVKIEVSRKFVSEAVSLQKHSDPSYPIGNFLRDGSMTVIVIPYVHVFLRNRSQVTAQKLTDCVVHRLSSRPITTEPVYVNFLSSFDVTQNNITFHTIS